MAWVCACGQRNSINHSLICPKGGFVMKRHDELRDFEAELLNEVCTSVETEPVLQPLSGESVTGNKAPDARLDVAAIGFWRPQERILVDVRVFHPNCKSYRDVEPEKIYKRHENLKKAEYNDRVINVERATLTPLIFSTTGGWGKEATLFHKHLARLIAEKRGENYNIAMSFIRKRIRFTLLRTILESLRGSRELKRKYINKAWKVADLDFNLVDSKDSDVMKYDK